MRRGKVLIHSRDQRDHQDERGDRQNDAQQHEKRAQLVRTHVLQRDQRRLAQKMCARDFSLRSYRSDGRHLQSWSCHVLGLSKLRAGMLLVLV